MNTIKILKLCTSRNCYPITKYKTLAKTSVYGVCSGVGSTGAPGAGAPMNRSYNQLVPFYSGVGTTGAPGAGAPLQLSLSSGTDTTTRTDS